MPSSSNKKAVFIANKLPFKDDIDSFIYNWNISYPIDRWWRERHKIAFNSPEHRVVSFLDIYIEWKEDQLYSKATAERLKKDTYKSGDWLEVRKEIIDDASEIEDFEKMDLSQFDDKK